MASPLPLVLCRRVEWLALALRRKLAFFALAALPSLLVLRASASLLRQIDCARALTANGSRLCFAVSSRLLPLLLCCDCLGVALFLCRRGKWLTLMLCR